jgi:hypothetical protein
MSAPHDTDRPMHIVPAGEYEAFTSGLVPEISGLCGIDLAPGTGADDDAPLCPECFAVSGWTHDKRKSNPDGHVRDLVAILTEG